MLVDIKCEACEDDYGYRDLVDEADNEEDSDDEPLDVADDALGPEVRGW